MRAARGVWAVALACGLAFTLSAPAAAAVAVVPGQVALGHDGESLLRLGRKAAEDGALDQAVALYRKSLAIAPHNAGALVDLGIALADLERWEDARTAFENALREGPENPAALNGLGYVHYKQERIGPAIDCYRAALSRRDDPQYHLNLGLAYLGQSRWGQAEDEFRRTVDSMPNDYWGQNDLGYALQLQGRVREAAEHYQRAVGLTKKDLTAHANLGGLLLDAHAYRDAVGTFTDALRLDDKSAEAHLGLANALRHSGQPGQALLEARTSLALRPDSAQGHYVVAEIYRTQRSFKQALPEIEAALLRDTATPAFHLSRGRILIGLERRADAIVSLETFLHAAPKDPVAADVRLWIKTWQDTPPLIGPSDR